MKRVSMEDSSNPGHPEAGFHPLPAHSVLLVVGVAMCASFLYGIVD